MTGYEICERAKVKAGVGSCDAFYHDANNSRRDLEFLNQILCDLNLKEISELSCEVGCDEKTAQAVCCGVAMLWSLCDSEAEKHRVHTAIYNAKRALVLGKIQKIEDTLPIAESGDL